MPRGHLQRAEERRALGLRESKLAKHLVERWAFGLKAATEVQLMAQLAIEDHDNSPEHLVQLGRLGTTGRHPNHCHVELTRQMRAVRTLPAPLTFSLPLKSLKRLHGAQIVVDSDYSLYHPGVMFNELFHNFRSLFDRLFLGEVGINPAVALRRFWSGVPEADPRKKAIRDEFMSRNDVLFEADLWERAVPIVLHGDAVPASGFSVERFTWYGVLAFGMATMDFKLILSARIRRCIAFGTEQTYWSVMIWALSSLLSGRFNSRNWNGRRWPAGSEWATERGNTLQTVCSA